MTGTEILRIANLNNMEVEVDVNENDIVKINIGDSAKIEVDAYLKREFKGIVTSISNSASTALTADQVTNFKVKVRILKESYQDLLEGKPDNYSPFRPGMTATVDIITERKEKIIAVPISAVVIKDDTTSVKKDIVAELEKPSRDPREEMPKPILRTDVLDMKDLVPGMKLKGTVRNVIDFGVFVDIGVHQDGLVHISQICDRFIKHPLEVLSVGDVVDVTVMSVDLQKKRIQLTMK